jgi:hypothetical protein
VVLQGVLILQEGYFQRYKAFLKTSPILQDWGLVVEKADSRKELILFSIKQTQIRDLVELLRSDHRFSRSIQKLTFVDAASKSNTIEELLQKIATQLQPEILYRLEVYPKQLFDATFEQLKTIRPDIQFSPKGCQQVVSVIQWPRLKHSSKPVVRENYFGAYPSGFLFLNSAKDRGEETAVCSARFKIQELIDHHLPQVCISNHSVAYK